MLGMFTSILLYITTAALYRFLEQSGIFGNLTRRNWWQSNGIMQHLQIAGRTSFMGLVKSDIQFTTQSLENFYFW